MLVGQDRVAFNQFGSQGAKGGLDVGIAFHPDDFDAGVLISEHDCAADISRFEGTETGFGVQGSANLAGRDASV